MLKFRRFYIFKNRTYYLFFVFFSFPIFSLQKLTIKDSKT